MPEPPVVDPTERERQPSPRPLLRTMLGEQLRRTRREQRRTPADVGQAAGVSMQYLSELERGRKEASSEVLAALCDALDIDLSDLLTAAGRARVESRDRRAEVLRLESIRAARVGSRPSGRRTPGAGDAYCLAA